jgi:hypothetical protein
MQAIRGIPTSLSVGLRTLRGEPNRASADDSVQTESRALVAIRPVAPIELSRTARPYPLASFLAHLIAVRERAPQTRRRGRAAPDEASAAYAARQATGPRPTDLWRKSA